jgi:adenine-specific DNA-methyltransferase
MPAPHACPCRAGRTKICRMAQRPGMTPKQKRTALETLGRDRLGELTAQHELEVSDRRSKDAHIDALIASRRLDWRALLEGLKREELQAMCDALGLDRSGREKALLVGRLLGEDESESEDDEDEDDGDAGGAGTFSLTAPEPRGKKKRTGRTRASKSSGGEAVGDYRHDDTRKNNPPAGLVEFDKPPPQPKKTYSYDAHLDPTLQWAGKAERTSFEVDTVSLHIHERVSTQAILRAVKREEAQRSLFEQFELPESKAIDFYQHDVGWANRMILGDSLVVMNSLLERESMAGKVQMVFMDPPYGVKFNSNFQPSIRRRDVKDGDDSSLTREPEQIQAYRDTWTLGIHSYLSYLRDRLLLARELLSPSGSIFVQIGEENLHVVRILLEEIFGKENLLSTVTFAKTSGATSQYLPSTVDYLAWYAKDRSQTKFRELFTEKSLAGAGGSAYNRLLLPDGSTRSLTAQERANPETLPKGSRVYRLDNLTSQSIGRDKGEGAACWFPVNLNGKSYLPNDRSRWKTNEDGMGRLLKANRLEATAAGGLYYVRFLDDFPAFPVSNSWTDTGIAGFASDKQYVVETSTKVVERCLLLTTDPGDLVLDPTCGSGTTAYVAEQWGRRWITCDTSRVALSLARQRLLTARFPFYNLRSQRVRDGFDYKTVPHITLKSIAQNPRLDACKTQAERERVIRETADQEVLYDQPEVDSKRVRVSGPYTVEAIPVAALADEPEHTEAAEPAANDMAFQPANPDEVPLDYVGYMIDLLKKSGVQFPGGRHLAVTNLRPVRGAYEYLHAECEVGTNGSTKRVAVSFGPQHAPVTPVQVRNGILETRGYDIVLFIGFACDPEARRMIDAGVHGRELQYANAAPDILVGDLLKTSKTTRLFTVYGAPDVKVHDEADGLVAVELAGVDLYDPNTGETRHSRGDDVAAWFVDHDYDGRTFCICQAMFPGGGKNPWEKLQKALKGSIDEDKFAALRTTRSLPFKPGKRIAVKVIDDRGNEVIKLVESKSKGRSRGGAG